MKLYAIICNDKDGSQQVGIALSAREVARKASEILTDSTGLNISEDSVSRIGRVRIGEAEVEVKRNSIRVHDGRGECVSEISVSSIESDMPHFAPSSFGRVYIIIRTDAKGVEHVSWQNSVAKAFNALRETVEQYESALEKEKIKYGETRFKNTSTIQRTESGEIVRFHVVEFTAADMRAA